MDMDYNFLFKYLNSYSPVGHEQEGQKVWLNYIEDFVDDYFSDTYGTVVGVINPGAEYKVVLEAHADEISWYVNYITKDGYIYLVRNGGSDYQIAPSMRANIHTKNGLISGVFGWPAIHVRETKEYKKPDIDTVFLDCGFHSDVEAKKSGVHTGCVVTFDAQLQKIGSDYLAGRGVDNRIGGYMIAQVAKELAKHNQKLPFSLYIVNAVQEEIGLRGAEMIANRIKPDLAIVTDVTHDTCSPHYNKKKQGDIQCGKGPVLTYGPAVQNNLLDYLISQSEKTDINIQRLAASRFTGTDTDAFAYSNAGVASALISIPLKYMHTTVEMINKNDITQIIKLMYHALINLDKENDLKKNFRYFDK